MLGHSSATMTIDTYGHLFENRLDEVADALDAARITVRSRALSGGPETPPAGAGAQPPSPAVAPVLPKERLVDLDTHRSQRKTAGQTAFESGTPGRIRTYASASGGRRSIP